MVFHIVHIVYILCFAIGFFTISLMFALYKRYKHKVFLYYGLFKCFATLSMIIAAVLNYSHIITLDFHRFARIFYLAATPFADVLQIWLIPLVVYAAVEKQIGKRLDVFHKVYAIAWTATFPVEILLNTSIVESIRVFTGPFFFHMYGYAVILFNFKHIRSWEVKKALKIFFYTYPAILAFLFIDLSTDYLAFPIFEKLDVPFGYILYYLDAMIIGSIFAFRHFLNTPASIIVPDNDASAFDVYNLSKREREILMLVLNGLTNRQISERLYISPKTVKNHIYSIYIKMDVSSRVQLMKKVSDLSRN